MKTHFIAAAILGMGLVGCEAEGAGAGQIGGGAGSRGPVGPVGPAGAKGPRGPVGLAGPVGPVGVKGPKGPDGERGAPGLNGADGNAGRRGPMGPAGADGPPGEIGAAGRPGEAGAIGAVGPAGLPGMQGPVGPAGMPGAPGVQGPTGAAGDDGVAGPAGATGERGPEGPVGPKGDTGPEGQAGAPGQPGPEGQPGQPGQAGPTGPEGPPGPTGPRGVSCFDPDGDGQSGDRNGDGAADVADCNAPEPITCAANLVLEWDGRAWVCNPEANVSSGDYAVFFDDFYRLSPFWSGDATLALSPQGGIELFATDESPADSNITVPIPSGADLFSLTANAYLEVRLARLPAGAATYGIGFVDGNALVGGLSKTLSGWEVSCREGGVQTGVGHSVAVSLVAPELIELEIDTSGAPALVVRVDEVEVARLTDCGASFAPAAIGFVKAPYGPEPQSISAIVDYVKWKAPREPAPMRGVGGVTGPVGGNGGNGGAGGNGP